MNRSLSSTDGEGQWSGVIGSPTTRRGLRHRTGGGELVVPCTRQPWRTMLTMAIFAGVTAVIVWRLHALQIVHSEDLGQVALRQRMRTVVIQAPRGTILDRRGQPLAVSSSGWDVFADPSYMDDRMRATVEISTITKEPREALRRQFEAGTNGRLIVRHIDDASADAIRALDLAGIHLRRSYRRNYPAGPIAPQVMGFVLADGSGGGGIEMVVDSHLRGVPGRETVMVDVRGRPMLTIDAEAATPVAGAHVQLSIDAAIQAEVEAALAEAVDKHRPATATALVVRPSTGEILAMASYPSFDPSDLASASEDGFRNNALAFVYESGSTMKPLIAGAAVSDGKVRWDERIFCENGRWTVRIGRGVRTISDHSLKYGGHGFLTVVDGVAKSDNILMAKLGLKIGPSRLYEWVHIFGFGSRTGIELPGENVGILLPRNRWNEIGSCMSVPMGHEMAVTPLQMAMAHAAVANRGVWMTPQVIQRVYTIDPRSGTEIDRPLDYPRVARRVLSESDALSVQDAMAAVMTSGTGRRLQLEGWTSAGKTGTTEKLVDGRYSKDRHIGSFVGWAPANRQQMPEAVVLVAIDDPTREGQYGGQTAGPVFKRIMEFTLDHLRVAKDQAPAPAPGRGAR